MNKFSYTLPNPLTPTGYTCSKCGINGVKLWRQSNTFANHIKLMCADCASKDQKTDISTIGNDGFYELEDEGIGMLTDQIGDLIPAVPTIENDTFWGYTSVPQDGCEWWYALPIRH